MLANVTSEPYTLIMGLHMNNVAWKVFVDSGLLYGPFIIMFFRNYLKAKSGGEHRGPTGDVLLSYIESDLYKMATVLIFFLVPMASTGGSNGVNYVSYSCSARNLTSGNDLNDTSVIGGITETAPKVAVGVWLVHEVSTYITNHMIANVPCASDVRYAQVAFDGSKIEDPQTQSFANEFYKQCFSPAINNIVKSGELKDASKELWIGSPQARSFYQKETSEMSIDKNYWIKSGGGADSLDPERGTDAYPNCDVAYQHFEKQIDKEVERLNEESWVADWFSSDSTLKDEFLRKTMAGAANRVNGLVSNRTTNAQAFNSVAGTSAVDSSGNVFTNGAVIIAADAKRLTSAVDAVTYRTMAPHVVAAVQMIILTAIPVILILSGLNMAAVGTISAWYFATEFTLLIEELGYWFDNMLNEVLRQNPGIFAASSGAESSILGVLGNLSYQWFPLIWLGLVSILGVRSLGAGMGGANAAAQNAGSTAASTVTRGAKLASGPAGKVGGALMRK